MKTLHALAGAVLFAAIVIASLFTLQVAFQDPSQWPPCLASLAGQRAWLIFGPIAALFLALIYALSGFRSPERVQYLAYDIEGGAVSISLKAIENLVARLGDEFAAVVSLHPKIRANNGAVDVQLDVKVKAGAKIPELCKMLQDRTRESISANVGISDVKEVRVRVQEIVMADNASSTDTKVGAGAVV